MATTPIVTEVTKEQLDALVEANGLREGLQYKVTDEDWLLIANGTDTLKSLSGSLKIINGYILPEYITTEVLFIDTGVIDTDVSVDTGVPYELIVPSGYDFDSAGLDVLTTDDVLSEIVIFNTINLKANIRFADEYGVGKYFCRQNYANYHSEESLSNGGAITANYNGNGNTFKMIIRFTKSYLQ